MGIKRESGITLVALVITIIVMLILAGVSLSVTVGENGILQKATHASERNSEATAEEELAMAWASCEADYLVAKANNSTINKKDYFEGNNENKGLKNYLNNPEIVESFTYNDSGTSMISLRNDNGTKSYFNIESDGKIKEVKIIEFTIDGKTYYAEKGMNWVDWTNSSYSGDFVFIVEYAVKNNPTPYTIPIANKKTANVSGLIVDGKEKTIEGVGEVYPYWGHIRVVKSLFRSNSYIGEEIIENTAYTTTDRSYEYAYLPLF